jgi:hypothetical protein
MLCLTDTDVNVWSIAHIADRKLLRKNCDEKKMPKKAGGEETQTVGVRSILQGNRNQLVFFAGRDRRERAINPSPPTKSTSMTMVSKRLAG